MSILEKAASLCKESTINRDESHGYLHSQKVAKTVKHKFHGDTNMILVAWLHDVADHKYDQTGEWQQRVKEFLNEQQVADPTAAWNAIEAISFSNEIKLGTKYYEKILSPYWLHVRNVVSDADKLEALGAEGAIRCAQYGESVLKMKNTHYTQQDVIEHLNQHVIDKLARLYLYFRTDEGMKEALVATGELTAKVAEMNLKHLSGLDIYT